MAIKNLGKKKNDEVKLIMDDHVKLSCNRGISWMLLLIMQLVFWKCCSGLSPQNAYLCPS